MLQNQEIHAALPASSYIEKNVLDTKVEKAMAILCDCLTQSLGVSPLNPSASLNDMRLSSLKDTQMSARPSMSEASTDDSAKILVAPPHDRMDDSAASSCMEEDSISTSTTDSDYGFSLRMDVSEFALSAHAPYSDAMDSNHAYFPRGGRSSSPHNRDVLAYEGPLDEAMQSSFSERNPSAPMAPRVLFSNNSWWGSGASNAYSLSSLSSDHAVTRRKSMDLISEKTAIMQTFPLPGGRLDRVPSYETFASNANERLSQKSGYEESVEPLSFPSRLVRPTVSGEDRNGWESPIRGNDFFVAESSQASAVCGPLAQKDRVLSTQMAEPSLPEGQFDSRFVLKAAKFDEAYTSAASEGATWPQPLASLFTIFKATNEHLGAEEGSVSAAYRAPTKQGFPLVGHACDEGTTRNQKKSLITQLCFDSVGTNLIKRRNEAPFVIPSVEKPASYTLIVNVPPPTTKQDLVAAFRRFGAIELATVVCDKRHRHPHKEWTATAGYAFVRFIRNDDAERALRDHLTVKIKGCRVRATWARKDSYSKEQINEEMPLKVPASCIQSGFQEFICTLCACLVNEPVVTACGHIHCSSCIREWIRDGNGSLIRGPLQPNATNVAFLCPKCRMPTNTSLLVRLDKGCLEGLVVVNNMLSQIKVRCPFCNSWTSSYSSFRQHATSCQKMTR